jgi:tetratricopeptide (TPR) repeat protein
LLTLLGLLLLVRALDAPAAEAPQPHANGTEAAAPTTPAGPIERLVNDRKWKEAILEVDALRSKAGPTQFADAESEFWAAHAEVRLKLYDAARQRFRAVAKKYPQHARAVEAEMEAELCTLREVGEMAETPEEIKKCEGVAVTLEGVATKYARDLPNSLRAWYVAGNAWRYAENDARAIAAYQKGHAVNGPGEYPAKSTYTEGLLLSRGFRTDEARKLFTDCIARWPSVPTAEKCAKALARVELVGRPAPPLQVETWLHGGPVDLAAERGKVVLLWFFATWCPHCKQTMPHMSSRWQRYKDRPFLLVAVTHNSQDQTTETAKAFVADPQWGITYPAAVDLGGRTSRELESSAVPAAVLIDKKGNVRWADHPLYLNDAMIERLMAE